MSNENIKDSEYYLRDISKTLNNLNKIMSCFLVVLTNESNFKSKTTNEVDAVVPKINEILKSIHKIFMIELSFIIGVLLIVLIGVYLMKANQLFIDEQNRKYIKPINKVNPKVKTK